MYAVNFEYLQKQHPEDNLPPTIKKMKPSKIESNANMYPINTKRILQMNEAANAVPQPKTIKIAKRIASTPAAPSPQKFVKIVNSVPIVGNTSASMLVNSTFSQITKEPKIVKIEKASSVAPKAKPKVVHVLNPASISNVGSASTFTRGNSQEAVDSNISGDRNHDLLVTILQKQENMEAMWQKTMDYTIKNHLLLKDIKSEHEHLKREFADFKLTNGAQVKSKTLPIRSQHHLDKVEERFHDYEDSLRATFSAYACENAFGLFRHFCNLILAHTDYHNWTGRPAHNKVVESKDNERADDEQREMDSAQENNQVEPKQASSLEIFKLLVNVGREKFTLETRTANKEMVAAIKAFNDAVGARERRRRQ